MQRITPTPQRAVKVDIATDVLGQGVCNKFVPLIQIPIRVYQG